MMEQDGEKESMMEQDGDKESMVEQDGDKESTMEEVGAGGHDLSQTPIDVDLVDYQDGDFSLKGYVSIPEVTPAPAVIIIPDWTGVDDYEKRRASILSHDLGWVGFAADIYGPEFSNSDDRDVWSQQYQKYRFNNTLMYSRMQAAIDVVKNHPDVMSDKIAIIGYCFGGTGILTYSFLSAMEPSSDIVGAVSFHGGLGDFPVSGEIEHPILVLSGGDDDASTAVEDLESTLNSANATWQITRYSGVEHAFTAWHDDRYNEVADKRSWHEMTTFLQEAFDEISYENEGPASDAVAVDYDNDGFPLRGYLSVPETATEGTKTPAVIIIPAWGGNGGIDGYEAQRATLLSSENGYIAFVADIYGVDMQTNMTFDQRIEQANKYRGDYKLFVSRMQAAVDVVSNHELVDADNLAMIGYCFGGTGVVDFAFAGKDNVKAVVPFHGGLTSLQPVETDDVKPYMLVQSGGEDDAHGNVTVLETELNMAKAEWEITRYSNVFHGFTHWGGGAYNARADWRSWDSMLTVLSDAFVSDDMDENKETMMEGDEDKETMMENGDQNKETMMEQDGEKESMMEQDGEKESMMEQDGDKESMMEQDGDKESMMEQDEDKESMMEQDGDKESTMEEVGADSGAYFVGNAAAGLFSLVLTIWFW